ncbi:MAG TPA: hypothetical protein VES92_11475, partial [Nitrospiraceae bacterium]|nr:hypothetical protein [Nitrospiraceae bacterium]
PRFHMNFIPTSSSWLNLIEREFHRPLQFRRGRVSEILDPVHEPRRLVEKLSCECRGVVAPGNQAAVVAELFPQKTNTSDGYASIF